MQIDGLPPIGSFHHIGVATEGIADAEGTYAALGYQREGEEFCDHAQGVRGVFLVGPGPRLELLEALGGDHTLDPWLRAGSRMYHLAFEVEDLDGTLSTARTQLQAIVVRPPTPAPAFGGRRIAFVMMRNRALIEFVEADPSGTLGQSKEPVRP
jgi:methylmalonyl-CoA/ethylmalonyl-CoA epimerase